MNTSIYLGKSNRANPDHVMAVREVLSRFDVDIVEYKGGAYSHKQLLKSDMLVVVPEFDEDNESKNQQWVELGRGLHDQIMSFRKDRPVDHKCDMLIVNGYNRSTKEISLGSFQEMDICDPNDYINHCTAVFDIDEDLGTLSQLLENRLGFQKSTSQISRSSSRYKLLLTLSK
jgi:hypothetical protein